MTQTQEQEIDRAKSEARAQVDSIVGLVALLHTEESDDKETARDTIQEDPLSVEVRGGWHNPGQASDDREYFILLSTGGPACRIIGELNQHHEPETARVEYQDWGTPWTEYRDTTADDDAAILEYAQQFYFGE